MRLAAMMLVPVFLATALNGCKGPESVQQANQKVATFHQRLDAGDYEAIWKDSGPDIQFTDKAAFIRLLAAVHDKLGKVRESRQSGWRTEFENGRSSSQLTMQTMFDHGSGEETFIYRGKGDEQKLAGYQIGSVETK